MFINVFLPMNPKFLSAIKQFQQPKAFLIRLGKIGDLGHKYLSVGRLTGEKKYLLFKLEKIFKVNVV